MMPRIPGLTERLEPVYRTAWYPDDESLGAEQYIVNAIWNLIVLENFPGKVWSDPFAKRAWLRYWRDKEAISDTLPHHPVITEKGIEKIIEHAPAVFGAMRPDTGPWEHRQFILKYIPFKEWAGILVKMPVNARKLWAKEANEYYFRTEIPIKVLTP